jgi:hypothetical protein
VHIAWKRSQTTGVPDLQDLEARDDTAARALVSVVEELARSRGYAAVRVSK